MKPTYPHPKPNMKLNVVDKPDPKSIAGMPSLAKLKSEVAEWLGGLGIKTDSWINITLPGSVMVIGNFMDNTPYVGMGAVEVFNGDITHAELQRLHKTWYANNKDFLANHRSPKMQNAEPKYHYAAAGTLMTCGATPANGGTVNAFTDKNQKTIYINAHVDDGSILVHEYIHTFDPGDPDTIGWGMDEGLVDFFARDIAARYGYKYLGNGGYEGGYQVVKAIVDDIGLDKVAQFWFERPKGIFGPLSEMTRNLAKSVKPGAGGTVDGKEIKAFCEKAESLSGWRAPQKSVKPQGQQVKQWPTVKAPTGLFRSHG